MSCLNCASRKRSCGSFGRQPPRLRPNVLTLSLMVYVLASAPAHALSPQDSLKQMKAADGFEVSLVASEPEIRQPLSTTFDERGRLWVIQYLQYPTPAGLKPVSVDNYLRTKYDRVPEPPPRGPKGADRITICELSEDRRRAIKFKDFVNGLNPSSSGARCVREGVG